MGWYDDRTLQKLVDLSSGTKPIHKQREKVVPLAGQLKPRLEKAGWWLQYESGHCRNH